MTWQKRMRGGLYRSFNNIAFISQEYWRYFGCMTMGTCVERAWDVQFDKFNTIPGYVTVLI